MENKVERISWRKVRRQMWWEDQKRKAKEKLDKVAEIGRIAWDHKTEIIATGAAVTGMAVKAKHMYDDYQSEREIYDPSLHKTLRLKRKLSTRQKRELQERFDSGEKIHDIIVDMGILK